jgi:hypothetical protein
MLLEQGKQILLGPCTVGSLGTRGVEGNLARQKAVDLDAVHSVKLVMDVDLAGSGQNSLQKRLEPWLRSRAVWWRRKRQVGCGVEQVSATLESIL